jgi:hypothetical protein
MLGSLELLESEQAANNRIRRALAVNLFIVILELNTKRNMWEVVGQGSTIHALFTCWDLASQTLHRFVKATEPARKPALNMPFIYPILSISGHSNKLGPGYEH